MADLGPAIKQRALELGFAAAGIAPAAPADGFAHLQAWLEHGYAGQMRYMERQAEARRHPSSILLEVRSVVMVAMTHTGGTDPEVPARSGKVARYARGPDYHDVLRERLNQLLDWVHEQAPGCGGRGVVDTAPLLERDFARRAGLGWFGKNTMLLNRRLGSYFLLGALLLDVELASDPPFTANHCGTCTACLRACPTEAFPVAGQLDARRCISYLTIELRESIPEELRTGMGEWVFGCDICQEVCPWNRKLGEEAELPHREDLAKLDLIGLLGIGEEEFRGRFRDTPLWRPKRRGLLRNAAIVLGNQGDAAALPALRRATLDEDPVIREAAAWAIEQIQNSPQSHREHRGKT
jgi:epoxyqueuosine reductase